MPSLLSESPVPVADYGPGAVAHTRTICKPLQAVYKFCRDPRNLSLIIKAPVAVKLRGKDRFALSRPEDETSLELQIIDEPSGTGVAWQSLTPSFPYQGQVVFATAPGDEGTEVTVVIREKVATAKKEAVPSSAGPAIADALRRMKALLEAGEIASIDGQPVGEPQKSKAKK